MSDEFEIKCNSSETLLALSGAVPRELTGYDGYSVMVSLQNGPVTCDVKAYDCQPQRWSEFFADLAQNWRGWDGEKQHETLEHNLRLAASIDSLGHVEIRVTIADSFGGSNWRAEDTLFLAAGDLDSLQKRAKAYFG